MRITRRSFLNSVAAGTTALYFSRPRPPSTRHLIFIVNGGGARKKDYYENVALSPNIHRLASEGFVFEDDHCDRVSSHDAAFYELIRGRESRTNASIVPTILDYVGNGYPTRS